MKVYLQGGSRGKAGDEAEKVEERLRGNEGLAKENVPVVEPEGPRLAPLPPSLAEMEEE